MISNNQKITLNIADSEYIDWKICLKNKLKMVNSNNIEIDSKNLELSCTEISEIIAIVNQSNCKVINFCSTSSKTIVSSQSLGYMSQLILENHPNETLKINEKNLISNKTNFHSIGDFTQSHPPVIVNSNECAIVIFLIIYPILTVVNWA